MRSVVSVDVAADPDLVFRLARNVERWPSLLPHYVAVAVERRTDDGGVVARFVARRLLVPILGIGVPVAWRSLSWAEPKTRRLRFRHLGGPTAGMDVTWRIEPHSTGSRISIEHSFDPRLAPWAPLLDRLVVRPIATRTLASFRSIAESVATAS